MSNQDFQIGPDSLIYFLIFQGGCRLFSKQVTVKKKNGAVMGEPGRVSLLEKEANYLYAALAIQGMLLGKLEFSLVSLFSCWDPPLDLKVEAERTNYSEPSEASPET